MHLDDIIRFKSSLDQNAERRLDGIPLDKLFTDKASGKDTNGHNFRRHSITFVPAIRL